VSRAIQILLVEDNPADADLTRETLRTSSLNIDLTVAVNGVEAVECVQKRGRFAAAATPDFILLDLNLPGIDGRGVLASIKQHRELKKIPVSILSSSAADRDITQSYELGANCYIVKPIDFKSFQAMVRAIESFWFGIAKIPDGQKTSDGETASVH
jgi:two-component system, chemotaxis family, response regulator Rcp1